MNNVLIAAGAWLTNAALLIAWHLDNKRQSKITSDLLERVSTEPRLELRPAVAPPAPSASRKYIADHPADDAAWNEFRGEPQEDE